MSGSHDPGPLLKCKDCWLPSSRILKSIPWLVRHTMSKKSIPELCASSFLEWKKVVSLTCSFAECPLHRRNFTVSFFPLACLGVQETTGVNQVLTILICPLVKGHIWVIKPLETCICQLRNSFNIMTVFKGVKKTQRKRFWFKVETYIFMI